MKTLSFHGPNNDKLCDGFSQFYLKSDTLIMPETNSKTYLVLQATLLLYPFNGLFSRTTWVSQYQKGKINLDLNEARDNGVLGCSSIS